MPIIVIAMITAASTQPMASSRPPNTIQSRFNRSARSDIGSYVNSRCSCAIGRNSFSPLAGKRGRGKEGAAGMHCEHPSELIEQSRRAGPAGRTALHLVGKTGNDETAVWKLFQIAQLLHMAIRNLAAGFVAFPDDRRVAGFEPALAHVHEGGVPAPGIDAGDAHAARGPQPAVRYSSLPMQLEARVLTSTISNGLSSRPMRLSSAATSAAVTT